MKTCESEQTKESGGKGDKSKKKKEKRVTHLLSRFVLFLFVGFTVSFSFAATK